MSVRIERDEAVTIISIDRPKARNAVDRPTADALAKAFKEFDADPDAHVAVLYGNGGNFCAGADLKAVASGDPARMNNIQLGGDGPMGPTHLQLSKPVIAAVTGYAVAGGLELALWADLRVAEEDAVFGVFCRRWGVPLIDGGTIRLPRLIGQSRAMDMILTGRPVDAAEAERFGLVNRVTPKGKALNTAVELAKQIAAFPQTCMRHDRLSVIEQHEMSMDGALFNEYEHGWATLQSGETVSGAGRFTAGAGRHGKFGE
ncbi:MAG: crotonase/enoyl-CoA hydratase family protein [Salinisphaeraceae bacterium]|nr:crotonase/enoyl-CoA hydratase family protein [Salinisphaeraceae bacterium]